MSATITCVRAWIVSLAAVLVAAIGCSSGGGDADTDASTQSVDALAGGGPDAGCQGDCVCVEATRLWFDDFETGDYSRWTSSDYGADWNNGTCHDNQVSTDRAVSGAAAHRSEITCAIGMSHRGYGGVQFDGDAPLGAYTNTGSGIEAPYGVVNTYWSWLDVPYSFENGRWFSFWTVNNSCDWSDNVITLGLEDPSNRMTPAHIVNNGGTVTFAPQAPTFPLRTWVRTTIYINYHDGTIHIWQDGAKLLDGTFSRSDTDICQWHWGAYASGDNTDVVLYEDDNSIWKLGQPWPDFDVEPYFGEAVAVCEPTSAR